MARSRVAQCGHRGDRGDDPARVAGELAGHPAAAGHAGRVDPAGQEGPAITPNPDIGAHYPWTVELTKARRNEIYIAIAEGGLDPATCTLGTSDETRFVITHESTASWFTCSDLPLGRYATTAADASLIMAIGTDPGTYLPVIRPDDMIRHLKKWAADVAEYERALDLWELGSAAAALREVTALETGSNTRFTAYEQREIDKQLTGIQDYVSDHFELTADQISNIKERLSELAEASKRVGRNDWVLMVEGAAVSLIVNAAVPQHLVVQTMLLMIVHGLGHLFTPGGMQPALPPKA